MKFGKKNAGYVRRFFNLIIMFLYIIVVGAIFIVGLGFLARELRAAPLGYEDATGFHLDVDEGAQAPGHKPIFSARVYCKEDLRRQRSVAPAESDEIDGAWA